MEKPQYVTVTIAPRTRLGINSEVCAIAIGIAPPMPSPVSNLKTDITNTEFEKDDATAPMPNTKVQKINSGLRPNLSARVPKNRATNIEPTRPNENIGPSSSFDIAQD